MGEGKVCEEEGGEAEIEGDRREERSDVQQARDLFRPHGCCRRRRDRYECREALLGRSRKGDPSEEGRTQGRRSTPARPLTSATAPSDFHQ